MSERSSALATTDRRRQPTTTRSWFVPLLMRLHFYVGIFVGPFMLVAALSGILYALTPQIESRLYADFLYNSSQGQTLPLRQQVEAAKKVAPAEATLSAVRPSPAEGDNTRVLFNVDGLNPSERLAVFVDPVTAKTHGALVAYGTSGVLPLRTWIDQLHVNLQLGDMGRYYSELAASWLWVAALGGLLLWAYRQRKPNHRVTSTVTSVEPTATLAATTLPPVTSTVSAAPKKRGLRTLHQKLGLFLLLGLLFFSATGLTWSRWAGDNIGVLRQQFGWTTPALSTSLAPVSALDQAPDPHAGHHDHAADPDDHIEVPTPQNATLYDTVLAVARQAGIDAAKVEIKQPAKADQAWSVVEIDRHWPTQVDAVAVNPVTLAVTDVVRFEQYPLAAKLTRWGIDMHMGLLFGVANELALVVVAVGLMTMVIMGYQMWWQGRPTRRHTRTLRSPFALLSKAPKLPHVIIIATTLVIGFSLPVMGVSLLAFLLYDWLRYLWLCQRQRSNLQPEREQL
ncbi:MAG: PepSY-associated TM helix domain-containing protein [Plesiomonas sp.]|uniref:PepSY-associated TM helix domain-containing protein n=2 Tax=Plesiomonas sp. TaxID=2486279 RepID=UPI003F2FCCDC